MDPDMVRQQEEAERESLLGLLKAPKLAPVPPFKSEASIAIVEDLRATIAAPAATSRPARPLTPKSSSVVLFVTGLGRFVQAAIAGAILGGGMGILVANMLGLAPDEAQIAVFGPALVTALVCAAVSLKAKVS